MSISERQYESALPVLSIGPLYIGDISLRAAVLEGETRVISSGSVRTMLGVARSGFSNTKQLGEVMPRFLSLPALKPFISQELGRAMAHPIAYRYKRNQIEYGYEANDIVDACTVWLNAREAGALAKDKKALTRALAAEHFIRSMAKVGIIALIDEATGFQEKRERDALQKFLSMFLSEEKLAWAKRFPDEFYKQIFRLKGWDYIDGNNKRPKILGKITNEVVYRKLAPGVLNELQKKNPADNKTHKRSYCHHQLLSPDTGIRALDVHLIQAIFYMKLHNDWDTFILAFHQTFPDPMFIELPEAEVAPND